MGVDISTAITLPGMPADMPLWDEGVEDHLGRQSSKATRRMRCLWPNRYFIAQLLRGSYTSGYAYVPPMPYPDAPWMYVDEITMKGGVGTDPATGNATGLLVGPNSMVGYRYALLEVKYRTADWLVDQQLGSLAVDMASQNIVLPGSGSGNGVLKFATTGNPSAADANYPITTIEFSRTINRVAKLPLVTAMAAARAPVNSLPFVLPTASGSATAGGTTAAPGDVRYQGLKSTRQIDSYGTELWNVTHRFQWRSVPHGYDANPMLTAASSNASSGGSANGSTGAIVGQFEQLVFAATGQPILARSDLNLLLSASAT